MLLFTAYITSKHSIAQPTLYYIDNHLPCIHNLHITHYPSSHNAHVTVTQAQGNRRKLKTPRFKAVCNVPLNTGMLRLGLRNALGLRHNP